MKKEYALWGTRNEMEDIIKVNGKETFNDIEQVKKIKKILEKRKEFEKIRIQVLDMGDTDLKKLFSETLK